LTALAVFAEAVGVAVPRPFASAAARQATDLGGVRGDLYAGDRPSRGIVLIHGAAPQGKDDPRFVRAARAVARAGRVVLCPALALAERRFDEADLDHIASSVLALGEHPLVRGGVQLLGISYGGSYALVASADPRLRGRLSQVAVFGAYFDLSGVIRAATTGVSFVGRQRVPWDINPATQAVLSEVASTLLQAGERAGFLRAYAGAHDPAGLAPGARALYDLLTNRDPERTDGLVEELPTALRDTFRRFSPATVADRIEVPVIALHSRADPAVPYGEALRLERSIRRCRLFTVGSFTHVDLVARSPRSWIRSGGDLLRTASFTDRVLHPQG
jgi:pimeloyl-ACP methyl ester carboxylesterase